METLDSRLQKRMHVSLYALLFLTCLLGLSVLLEGCTDTCESTTHYTYFEPVYTSFEELQASTGLREPQPISAMGKIYIKGQYLFVNDPGKGIHIIDNSHPENPVAKNFLSIPGNYDLAVKGNTLYADSYIDLVAFNIANVADIKEVTRIKDVFNYFNHDFGFYAEPGKGIITSWEQRDNVEVSKGDCNKMQSAGPIICYSFGVATNDASSFRESLAIAPGNGSAPGVGGSMARFTINKNFLYSLNTGNLQPFDITVETSPVAKEKVYVNWDVETIFPYADNLFIGSSSGMHIYDVKNPALPSKVSTYEHIRSCDPVVVDENFAYVTLRSGNECAGFTNQLEIIDIADLQHPKLLKTYAMTNPHGLGIDNKTLFICDGNDGLKIYDASDIHTITEKMLAHNSGINAFDVIPFNNILIMIGQDGIFQYDYSDLQDIKLLSHIACNEN